MKAKVKEQGLLIPKRFLRGAEIVQFRWKDRVITVKPMKPNRIEAKLQDRITLTNAEWSRFMKVMENPPRPNKALMELAKKHKFA